MLQLKTLTDPTGRLTAQRAAATQAALAGNLAHPTRSRKVCIVRLQAAISELLRGGKRPTDAMHKLAGLTGISSVFRYPELGELAKLVQFQRMIPSSIPQQQRGQIAMQVSQSVKESLGMSEVKVFGVAPSTRFAAVMIEADYQITTPPRGVGISDRIHTVDHTQTRWVGLVRTKYRDLTGS